MSMPRCYGLPLFSTFNTDNLWMLWNNLWPSDPGKKYSEVVCLPLHHNPAIPLRSPNPNNFQTQRFLVPRSYKTRLAQTIQFRAYRYLYVHICTHVNLTCMTFPFFNIVGGSLIILVLTMARGLLDTVQSLCVLGLCEPVLCTHKDYLKMYMPVRIWLCNILKI